MTTHGTSNGGLTPLKWPEFMNRPSALQKLLMGFPLIGPNKRLWRTFRAEVARRSPEALSCWGNDHDVIVTRDRVSRILMKAYGWPTDYFLPDDACDVLLWDPTLDMRCEEAVLELESAFPNIHRLWDRIRFLSYGEFISMLSETSKECPSLHA